MRSPSQSSPPKCAASATAARRTAADEPQPIPKRDLVADQKSERYLLSPCCSQGIAVGLDQEVVFKLAADLRAAPDGVN